MSEDRLEKALRELREKFDDHCRQDMQHHKQLAATLEALRMGQEQVKEDTGALKRAVFTADGGTGLSTRVSILEERAREGSRFWYWLLPTICSGAAATAAVVAIFAG